MAPNEYISILSPYLIFIRVLFRTSGAIYLPVPICGKLTISSGLNSENEQEAEKSIILGINSESIRIFPYFISI